MIALLSKYKHHIHSTFWYIGTSLFVAVISIAINPLLAKNLAPDDYAIIGYFTSFNILILPLLNLSLTTYFLRKYFCIAPTDRDRVNNTMLISIIFIGLLSLILFCSVFYIFCRHTNVEFPFFPYAILTFTQVYLSTITTFHLTKLRLAKKAKEFGITTLASSLFGVAFSLIFVVYYKFGAEGRLWSLLAASFILAIYSFKKVFIKWEFDISILKEALRFGFPLTLSAILWYFLSGIDRAMLSELNDTYHFGIYSVAIQISSYLLIFYTSMSNALEPDIFQAGAEGKMKKMILIMAGIMIVVILANGLFIVFAPYVIGFLTAERYTNASGFAQILSLHNITMALYYLVIKMLVVYGFVKTELVVRIIGAIFAFVLFKVLIANYGFNGAAWGQVLSFLTLSVLGVIAFVLMYKRKNNYGKESE